MNAGFKVQALILLKITLALEFCLCARWTDVKVWLDQYAGYIRQRPGDELHLRRRNASFIQFRDTFKRSEETSFNFNLSPYENLEETDISSTLQGTDVIRVQETFKGIPVYDAIVTVETDKNNGYITGQVSGHVLNEIDKDLGDADPTINEAEAVQILIAHFNVSSYSSLKTKLFVYKDSTEERARLVWRISFFYTNSGTPSRPCCFIDAHSSDLIQCFNYLERFKIKAVGGNKKTGKLTYGMDMPFLNVRKKKAECKYKSDEVEVFDYRSVTDSDDPNLVTFDCGEGVSDSVNGAYSPSTDAYFFGKMTVKMFKEWTNSPVCNIVPLQLVVHYNKDDMGAFFDGYSFKFSDGNPDSTYPYVTTGVVAHEIGHCFTEDNAGLEYYKQSGAIDESFADLVGEAAKYYIFGYNDWKAGSDVLREGDFTRFLCDQSIDGYSITHTDQYTADTDVHFSSGIFSKAICEMTKSPDLNLKYVFQVFAHANRFYWHPSSDFSDAACGVIKAAYDLGHDITRIQNAFAEVGVKTLETCNIKDYIRQIFPDTSVPRLSAGLAESVIFKIVVAEDMVNSKIKIKTSQGTGDVDLYLASEPSLQVSSIISVSDNIGNYEAITVDLESEAYAILKPRLFKFTDVMLTLKLYR